MIGISSTESSKTTGDSTKTAEGKGSGFQRVRGSSKMALTYNQVKLNLLMLLRITISGKLVLNNNIWLMIFFLKT